MMRTLPKVALGLVVLLGVPIGTFFGCMYLIERQRMDDANAAFVPILHLRCMVYSQPVAFHRYCRYVVEFPPDCELCDANVTELRSLNRLPPQNTLHVTIHTRRLTDESLPHLKAIDTFDVLDVTDTSISDEGIEELREAFPRSIISTRKGD